MLPLCTRTPLPPGTVPVTLRWGECASIEHIFKITTNKWAIVKVERGAAKKPSPTTKAVWRQCPGTSTNTQKIKSEGQCE